MIKLLAMDVDGTLTDGKIYMGANGEIMKAFSVKDGQGIRLLQKCDIKTAIITSRSSTIVENRAKELDVDYVSQGVANKARALIQICEKAKININEVAYIGDDINDLEVMEIVAIKFAPANAVKQIKIFADYVLDSDGGEGAVRECAEKIIEMKL